MSPKEYEAKVDRAEKILQWVGISAYRLYSTRAMARVFVAAVDEGEAVDPGVSL